MNQSQAQKIRGVYDSFEAGEPGISTERLIAQTADACRCTDAAVAEALRVSTIAAMTQPVVEPRHADKDFEILMSHGAARVLRLQAYERLTGRTRMAHRDQIRENNRLRAQNDKLKEALQFYANRMNELEVLEQDDTDHDGAFGAKARETLNALSKP